MRILWSILLLLALLPDYSGDARLDLWPPRIELVAHPVDLDWRNPARKRLGGLTFLGGVRLTSPTRGVGGFSAMAVDGDRFTLLSDGGNYVRFRLDSRWHVSQVSNGALYDGPGRGWRKLDRDSESLARDPATGTNWVGFESTDQIWRYDAALRAGHGRAVPAMAKWPSNGGAEAMVRMRDGSFVVFAESASTKVRGVRPALWFAGDPVDPRTRGFRFGYRPPVGFVPTDVAELPDGRLVVINRAASLRTGFTATVAIVERGAIRTGRIVTGREIARFAAPVVHDNFEAVAVVREGRDTILWIASDDNQLPVQRSLLLKFRLDERAPLKRRTARTPGGSGPIR